MKLGIRRIVMTLAGVATLSASVLSTAGCGAFFSAKDGQIAGPGRRTTGAGSGDYAYVTNSSSSASGIPYLDAFDVSKGLLTPLAGSPYQVDFAPVAVAVAPSNNFLYLASPSAANPGIELFSLSSGVPSITSSGLMASEGQIAAMAISPDGNWLYTIEFPSLNGINWILQQYQLTPSTGVMKLSASFNIPFLTTTNCSVVPSSSGPLPTTQLCSIAVAPSGGFVIVASGNGGAVTYPYSSSGGVSSASNQVLPAYSAASADLSVAVDSSNVAYIGQTDTLSTYALSSSGTTTNTTGNQYTSASTPAVGSKPRGVTLSTKSGFVYVANQGAGTISQYSTANGVLTSLGAAPAGPASVSALGVDNTGAYLVAAGYNSTTGIQLYSITAGVISNLVQNAGTGTDFQYPVLIAMTH